jgi:hypothetical protein
MANVAPVEPDPMAAESRLLYVVPLDERFDESAPVERHESRFRPTPWDRSVTVESFRLRTGIASGEIKKFSSLRARPKGLVVSGAGISSTMMESSMIRPSMSTGGKCKGAEGSEERSCWISRSSSV